MMLSTLWDHLMLYSCMLDVFMCMLLHVIFLYAYVVACFRSDIPITIVSMISSMSWDVMCRGWLVPMMVLRCYWRLGGITHLVVFYVGWLSFMMIVISLMMDGCIMYGGWFHLLSCTCIMDLMRMMYLYFYICILF